MGSPYNVLFLCTGNSARSIMAECTLKRWGDGRFRAFSAGSHPRGEVHPMTLAILQELQYDTRRLRSKSWAEFADQGAPPMDCVITVCDQAAKECPMWARNAVKGHWWIADPAAVVGTETQRMRAFQAVYLMLEALVKRLCAPLEGANLSALEARLKEIERDWRIDDSPPRRA